MEKKPESCAVLKIDASSALLQKTTFLKWLVLSYFFELKILIRMRTSSPTFPQVKKVKKQLQMFSSALKNRKQNQNEKITYSGTSCESQVRQNAFSALMEKKPACSTA